jgi:hypothetical protein
VGIELHTEVWHSLIAISSLCYRKHGTVSLLVVDAVEFGVVGAVGFGRL